MDHNNFDIESDIIDPTENFLVDNNIIIQNKEAYPDKLTYCQLSSFQNLNEIPENYERELLYQSLEEPKKGWWWIF